MAVLVGHTVSSMAGRCWYVMMVVMVVMVAILGVVDGSSQHLRGEKQPVAVDPAQTRNTNRKPNS